MAEKKEITVEAFLKAIDFNPEDLKKEDAVLEDIVASFHDKQKEHWFEIYKNSDEFKSSLTENEGKIYAKQQKIIDSAIKKAGLVLTDEQAKMKPQEKIELLSQHLLTANSGTKEIGELQAQILEWKNKYTDLEKDAETKIQNAISEADKKVLADKINFHLKNKFISIPKEKLVGSEHLDIHWIGLDAKLKEKYDVSFDDKGEFIFFKKGTQQRAEGKKDGRDVILTADEIITSQLKENKSWVESNGKGKEGQQEQKQEQKVMTQGNPAPAAHLAAMQALVNGQ